MTYYSKIKFIYKIFFLNLLAFTALAQIPEPVVLKAYYKFSHQYDTTKVSYIKKENYVLLLSKSSSIYRSYDLIKQDSAIIDNYTKTGVMNSPKGNIANAEMLYYYINLKKCYLKMTFLDYYVVDMPFDELNWKIDKESKKILGFNCQKATTTYHSRNYIVWFTTDLPYQSGPWKLHGLPGLILSAYDKTGRIKFNISSIEQVKSPTEEITLPKMVKHITIEELEKVTKNFKNNSKSVPDKSVNFPLELKIDEKD